MRLVTRVFTALVLAALPAFALAAGISPDAVDRQALAALHAAVQAQLTRQPEAPLAAALAQLAVRGGETSFANVGDPEVDGAVRFPTQRPAGVSANEWRALRRSHVDGGGENGRASYTLLDVDGDGQRDLIVDAYTGGTGLFSTITVLRRRGAVFEGKVYRLDDEGGADTEEPLYILNGRGSNQSATWVRISGRVYAAYVEGRYGEDKVSLLRPWHGTAGALSVRYAYELSVPREQAVEGRKDTVVLDAALHAALTQAVLRVPRTALQEAAPGPEPVCPPSAPGGAEESSMPNHYQIEVVADVPVWLGGVCRAGRLIDWFGRCGERGLYAELWVQPWVQKPGVDAFETFEVVGRRRVVSVRVVGG